MDEQDIVAKAEEFAKEYIAALKFDGKENVGAIVEALRPRTHEGEPVVHLVLSDPAAIREAIEIGVRFICTVNALKKQKPSKRERTEAALEDVEPYYNQLMQQFPEELSHVTYGSFTKAEKKAVEKEINDTLKKLKPAECIWDYFYMSYYGSAFKADGIFNPTEFIKFDFLPAMAAGLGYFINLGSLAIGVVQPHARRDDQNNLHSATGPALTYGEWKAYYWHGTEIPSEWIEAPNTVPVETALKHPNIEQRRCFAEIVGWAKVLDKLTYEVLDEDLDENDNPRQLLLVDLPDAPAEKFCRVICGTGRTFAIPVSSSANTALDAIAESYGVPASVYKLVEKRA